MSKGNTYDDGDDRVTESNRVVVTVLRVLGLSLSQQRFT